MPIPTSKKQCSKFSIFDIEIDNLTMQESINRILCSNRKSKNKRSRIAYFVNANTLNQSYVSIDLKNIFNRSDLVFADGYGVKLAAKRKGVVVKDNVNGTDMLPLLCDAACVKNKSIFMLGSAPGVAKDAAKELRKSFPSLNIVGCHHGFIDTQNSMEIVNKINASGANILLVGMGTPIQETWLDKNAHHLETDIAIAVGGLFDFFSNRIPRAPFFFRKNGMEWVWRLIQEPRVKFYRYVIGNPLFLLRMSFH